MTFVHDTGRVEATESASLEAVVVRVQSTTATYLVTVTEPDAEVLTRRGAELIGVPLQFTGFVGAKASDGGVTRLLARRAGVDVLGLPAQTRGAA
ncbi:hypothetical protein [Zhihengliuella halotolerans]|uniref:hypothetical protein n=1 Tax=Zhihengliuella halotolerans TaxID=370736 RepID=UPI000C80847D|nr:hypothetical protein [Zhihengliuella halotolerans]